MSLKSNKNLNLKRESLFNENKKRKIYRNINKIKILESPNKILNIVQFIKQKNKFFIEDTFNAKGSREFLSSKEIAMRVIILNDEIEKDNVNKKEKSIKQKSHLQLNNLISLNKKRHKSSKITGKRTISPKKSRKKVKSMNFEERENKNSPKKMKDKISNNRSNMKSNYESKGDIIEEKKESNISGKDNICTFFIDNENEPDEDHFQNKLKKEIRKYESLKNNNIIIKKNNALRKSKSKNYWNYKGPKRMNSFIKLKSNKEIQNQFLFSEMNKSKMKEDDINASSINGSDRTYLSPKKAIKRKVKRHFSPVQIKNKQIKKRLDNQIDGKKINGNHIENNKNENEEDRLEIRSEKDSLMSILSDLV